MILRTKRDHHVALTRVDFVPLYILRVREFVYSKLGFYFDELLGGECVYRF